MSDWRDPYSSDEPDQRRPLKEANNPEDYGTLSDMDAGLTPADARPACKAQAPTDAESSGNPEAVTSLVKAIESGMDEVRRLGEDLSQRESSMTERVVNLDRQSVELSSKLASINTDRARLAARESAFREQSESLDRQEADLRRRKEEAEARLSSIEARETELADQDAVMCRRAQSLDLQASTVHEQDESIASRERAINDRAGTVEESEREVESLRLELAAEREKVREAATKLKQEHAALTEMKSAALEDNDRSLEEREHDLGQLRASLDMERDRLAEQLRNFEAQKQSMLDGGAPALTSFEQQQQFEDRERELEEARLNVSSERERLDEITEQLQRERESVRRERSAVEVDRDRGAAMAAIGAAMDKTMDECRIRRERLQRVRIALRERSAKLENARQIIRGRHKECERILAMRDGVVRVQEEIEEQRASISRHEDRSRVVGVVLKLVVAIAILGGLSWAVADRVAPTTNLVRATIMVHSAGAGLDDASREAWSQYCESLSMDPRLIEETAARLKRRGVETLGTPGAVNSYFKDSLTIDAHRPGELNIALKGEGGGATRRVLETYLAAFVAIANDARGQRANQASTVVSANATVDRTPVSDDRLKWAGVMWAVSTLLVLLIGWALWSKLAVSAGRSEGAETTAFGVG